MCRLQTLVNLDLTLTPVIAIACELFTKNTGGGGATLPNSAPQRCESRLSGCRSFAAWRAAATNTGDLRRISKCSGQLRYLTGVTPTNSPRQLRIFRGRILCSQIYRD